MLYPLPIKKNHLVTMKIGHRSTAVDDLIKVDRTCTYLSAVILTNNY